MAQSGKRRAPEDFPERCRSLWCTKKPEADSDLLKPIIYRITLEDGVLWKWIRGRRSGRVIYYGHIVEDLR